MARLLLAADGHYYRDSNDDVYVDAVYNYSFYERYLSVFDEVVALGRMTHVDRAPKGKRLASGLGVTFVDLKPGHGVLGFVKTGAVNRRIVREAVHGAECVIARVSGMVGNMVATECRRQGRPYSIEVVVDPWEYFAPGANGGKVAPIVRRFWSNQLRKDCETAVGVSYVTEKYLQERYPCRAMRGETSCFTSHYSSVDLADDSFGKPKAWGDIEVLRLVHVANNFQGNGKGHLTLFEIGGLLKKRGVPFILTCVGDGPSMGAFKDRVAELGIADCVIFTGRLADGVAVREVVHKADLFVFPTRAEGLPRVLLEAMAEGVPCLSTPVCGIPEILPKECLFAPDDAEGFAAKIAELKANPSELERLSVRGIETAKGYASSVLQRRREEFYSNVRDHSSAVAHCSWICNSSATGDVGQ